MENNMIDISGLDKGEVLYALYKSSHVQGLGFLQAVDNYTVEDAKRDYELSPNKYFDYHYGRVMKVSLAGDSFNPRLYDRDNGEGQAKKTIDALRQRKNQFTKGAEQ